MSTSGASSESYANLWSRLIKEHRVSSFKDPLPLLDCWMVSFNPVQQSFIKDRLGPILYLPKVHVPAALFRALTHLWEPKEVAFCLGPHILSPTIEEYARLLQAPPTSEGIYTPNMDQGPPRIISEFLGIKRGPVITALQDCNEHCIRLSALMEWFGTREDFIKKRDIFCTPFDHWEDNRVNAFIAAAFATILFPHGDMFIHYRVVELVAQYLAGKSYIPALLAEQIRSLNYIKTKGQGNFKASMHLLITWFASHTEDYGHNLANGALVSVKYNLIQSFTERVHIEDNEPTWSWLDILEDMTPEAFIWKARWFKCPAAILGCKEYPAVPLIGITGCTGYYPASVIRQYGMLQDITIKPELEPATLDYLDPKKIPAAIKARVGQIKALWDTREVRPVYEIDPENKETRRYKATRWYIASQLKKNKDIRYEAPDVLEAPPTEQTPEIEVYKETVAARLEVHYRDFREKELAMTHELQRASAKIFTLESELREAKKKIKLLEEKDACPSKIRRLV